MSSPVAWGVCGRPDLLLFGSPLRLGRPQLVVRLARRQASPSTV
jgi:hypothetical protein